MSDPNREQLKRIADAARKFVAAHERVTVDRDCPTINEGIALAGLVYELDRVRTGQRT